MWIGVGGRQEPALLIWSAATGVAAFQNASTSHRVLNRKSIATLAVLKSDGSGHRTPKVRSVNGHVGPWRVEDFADEPGLEAVQEFAEFQVTLLGVQAEEVVEDDLLWPVS